MTEGTTPPIPVDSGGEFLRRLLAKVVIADGCWVWQGAFERGGYGRIRLPNGRELRAHRAAYTWLRGTIPDGLVLDHLCRNRACVNPDHLEPVTSAENVRRGKPIYQTHCKRGHEFAPENTYTRATSRTCKRCALDRHKAYRDRVRESP